MNPDQVRKIDISSKFFLAREAREKNFKTHFFLFENLENPSKSRRISAKKVTVYLCQMVMHFKYVLNSDS